MTNQNFQITDYIEFDSKGRAICPACELDGKTSKKNLSLVPGSDGAYKCFRGHTPQEIRDALGNPKPQQIPKALVATKSAGSSTLVTPQKAKQTSDALIQQSGKDTTAAKLWLLQRGINTDMIRAFGLGITRCKVGDQMMPAIAIPIPNPDRTGYWLKKRVAPWEPDAEKLPEYTPWKQYGIPQQVYFTNKPDQAAETWLCEGEWDAIVLGWTVRNSDLKDSIAVATFTCGCKAIPPEQELDRLQGAVKIFYDRDEPGESGAIAVANKLGNRATVALVPRPQNCTVKGWDISDALKNGFNLTDLQAAAKVATKPEPTKKVSTLKSRLVSHDELMARAPDFVDMLIPDLLSYELYVLAAPPRGGKSLMMMTLAHAVASGAKFLDRPTTQGGVLIINLEDAEAKVKERAIAQGWGEGLPIWWVDKFKLEELSAISEVIDELPDLRLIIIDTLSRAKSSNITESSAEMSQLLEPLQELAKERNICIMMTHHTGKLHSETMGVTDAFDQIRGSSAIRATCRGAWMLAPGDNCYRLITENGFCKEDLKIRLDSNDWVWKLIGKWSPAVDGSQKDQILEYLRLVGVATVSQISEGTGINAKTVGTVLGRLQADDMVLKKGGRGRQPAVYSRSSNLLQQLEQKLEHPNVDGDCDLALLQQKNNFSSISTKPDQSGTSNECDTLITFTPPTNGQKEAKIDSNTDPEQDVCSNICSNNGSVAPTVGASWNKPDQSGTSNECDTLITPLKEGDQVEVWNGKKWLKGKYRKPADGAVVAYMKQGLHEPHWIVVGRRSARVALPDIRRVEE